MQVTVQDRSTLTPLDNGLFLVSLPEAHFDSEVPEIFLAKQLNNEVMFYIKASEDITTCYIDSDITYDSSMD
jgi:hypothetical protein